MSKPGSRLVVGISGASGAVYGVRVLEALRALGVESHLVVSKAAALTLQQETGLAVSDLNARADVVHKLTDVGATIASGSFRTLGMIIAPCSVERVPPAWIDQLTDDGRMVCPVDGEMLLVQREGPASAASVTSHGAYRFVPLIDP